MVKALETEAHVTTALARYEADVLSRALHGTFVVENRPGAAGDIGISFAAKAAPEGLPVCITATLVDGLVLARAAMHHSVNFRSVVVMGPARVVDDPAEKTRALSCLLDHVAAGRAADCRAPNARELAATGVLALDLVEVSAKVRTGAPVDDPEDVALPHWAGVLPVSLTVGAPVPAGDLDPAVPAPPYATDYSR